MHLTYIWIVLHLCAKNYQNWWKFDEVLTKTNLLSFFGTRCTSHLVPGINFLLYFVSLGLISLRRLHHISHLLANHLHSYHFHHPSLLDAFAPSSTIKLTLFTYTVYRYVRFCRYHCDEQLNAFSYSLIKK